MKCDYKIGDTVYFYEHWSSRIASGEIEKFIYDDDGRLAGVKLNIDIGGCMSKKIENIFPAEEICKKAQEQIFEEKKEKYKASISSVEDLVKFAYRFTEAEEYTNHPARAAIREKADELLDIELGLD